MVVFIFTAWVNEHIWFRNLPLQLPHPLFACHLLPETRCIDLADCSHLCQSNGFMNGSGQVTNDHDCSGGNATFIWKCIPTTTTNL